LLNVGIPLLEVIVRRPRDRRRRFGDAPALLLDEARLDAQTLWICVPDGEIARVSERIAERRVDLRGQTVLHSSGALAVDALEAVKRAGAAVGGIAPVFSFPTHEPVGLDGVMFVVEADSDRLRRILNALVRGLGGKPLRVDSTSKVLYHAAATMASPLMVSAVHTAVETAQRAGLEKRDAEAVIRVLALATLGNYFEKGSNRSFSGAFARGDVGTVELHLQALLAHPTLHTIYLELARRAVASLTVRNRVELERVLRFDGHLKAP
jgi:predicted short-subunit dehydrogenase-like oxidoreductase (DUF2520 family)